MALIGRASFGRWTRLGLGAELALLVVLALAAAVLCISLAEWRPLRLRVDLTATSSNTLDPATTALLRELPRPVEIDVFFSRVPGSLGPAVDEIQARTQEVLFLVSETAGEKVTVRTIPADRVELREERARELRLQRDNAIVVSSGARRVVLRAESDLASIAQGDPRQGIGPSVVDFRAEEALVEALGRVASDAEPRVLFTAGQGEPDPETLDIARELSAEGFAIGTWDFARDGAVPDGATVLAVLAPEQPFPPAALDAIRAFVVQGGGLLVAQGAPFLEGPGSPLDLLEPYGLRLLRGLVCVPLVDPRTGQYAEGYPEVSALVLGPELLNGTHPVTQTLSERGRRLRGAFFRALERGRTPPEGSVQVLLAGPEEGWRDLPSGGPEGRPNWMFDAEREERGRVWLAATSEFRTSPQTETRARVVALGALDLVGNEQFETNRDFALNAFNWLAQRDFRVRVARRDPFRSVIDLERGPERLWAERTAIWYLPVGALLGGVLLFFLRRR
ncbi:MAG: hypothetical protein GC161_07195 [Planctomycetaceae bacterium]|nr:hypothetical protein [Planctomycetaceae bacterium]